MALSLYLLGYHRASTPNAMESKSYRIKWRLFITTLIAILGAVYYFARHNNYCEPLSESHQLSYQFKAIYLISFRKLELDEYEVESEICCFSVYVVRIMRIFGHTMQHGLPYDFVLGLSEPRLEPQSQADCSRLSTIPCVMVSIYPMTSHDGVFPRCFMNQHLYNEVNTQGFPANSILITRHLSLR